MREVEPPAVQGTENWKPLVMFTDQSQSFAHGAEFGMIWEKLRAKTFTAQSVRVENEEVLKAAAAHYNTVATFEQTDVEGWLLMTVEPFKLSVV